MNSPEKGGYEERRRRKRRRDSDKNGRCCEKLGRRNCSACRRLDDVERKRENRETKVSK